MFYIIFFTKILFYCSLDGGAYFYTTYETKDGQWMAVGALEPQFYAAFLKGLGLTEEQVPQFENDYNKYHTILAEKFKQHTRDEWCKVRLFVYKHSFYLRLI